MGKRVEAKTGKKKYHKLLADGAKHPIEKTGARLRGLMPWIAKRNLGVPHDLAQDE